MNFLHSSAIISAHFSNGNPYYSAEIAGKATVEIFYF